MTDVGKIKLSVEINADDLSAKLGEAVRKAIAPALAEIQRELNKVQREYDQTAKAAEESNAIQVAGAKEVTAALKGVRTAQLEAAAASKTAQEAESRGANQASRAIRDQADAIDKVIRKQAELAAASRAANAENERDIHKTTRAWEEQTAAIIANTAARAANAAAPTGGGPGRGGGGPGRGGSGAGGGGHGVLGFLTGPLGLNAIALGAQAIPAALTGITELAGAVVQLGQAGLALPAIYGAAGASIGTLLLGVHGMKDAITALNKAAAPDATAAEIKKAAESVKDLAPAAKETAVEVSKLMQGPWKDLQKGVSQNMFAGVAGDLDSLNKKALPGVSDGLGKIGTAWNGTLKTLFGSLGDNKNLSLIDRFLGNTAQGQTNANKAIDPIVHAFSTLLSTGGEFLPRLGDALGKVATRFDDFVSKAGKSGQLWKWIDEGLNGLRALGNSILNIGKTLTGLTHASGDGGFLGWLERATGKMQAFVNSTDGQGKLHDFFALGTEGLHQWGDLFKALGPDLASILKGFATWGSITLPIVTALAEIVHWMDQMPGLIQGIVTALLALKTVSGLIGLGGKLGGVGGAAGGGAGILGTLGFGANASKLNRGLTGLGLLAAGTVTQQSGGGVGNQILGGLGTVGGAALTGATIGSIFPGPGTAIGAAVGATAGGALALYNITMGEAADKAKAAADAQTQLAIHTEEVRVSTAAANEAMRGLSDTLINSGGKADDSVISALQSKLATLPDEIKATFGPDAAKGFQDSIAKLGLSNQDLNAQIAAGGPVREALLTNLRAMGPAGQSAAGYITDLAFQFDHASQQAAEMSPALKKLADSMDVSVGAAAATLRTELNAIPKDVPITTHMAGVDGPGGVVDLLDRIGAHLKANADGTINMSAPNAPEVDQLLSALHLKLTNLNGVVTLTTDDAAFTEVQRRLQLLTQPLQVLIGPVVTGQNPTGQPPLQAPGGNPWALPRPPGGFMGGIMRRRGYADGGWPGGTGGAGGPAMPGDWGPGVTWGPNGVPGMDPEWLTQFPWARRPDGSPFMPGDPYYRNRRGVGGYAGGGVPGGLGTFTGNGWNPDMQEVYKGHVVNKDDDQAKRYIDGIQNPADMKWWPGMFGDNAAPGRAGGGMSGVLPGYSPGIDNMMVPLSGGEGIIIPEAMRALGPDWLYGLNSHYRSGLSKAGYAGGGVFGYDDGGIPGGDSSVTGLLTQIRDLLAGKASATAPLNTIASATTGKGGGLGGAGGGAAVGGAAGFVNGIAEWFFGKGSPILGQLGLGGAAGAPGIGGLPGAAGPDRGRIAAMLQAFAGTGNLADVAGLGLDANDPIIRAIVGQRNSKKGLGSDTTNQLIQQVIAGGGYNGTLDSTNSGFISSLQTFSEKLAKGGVMPGMPGLVGPTGALSSGGPKGSKAGLQPAAANLWDVIAAQFPQIQNIGGVRADRLPYHPEGRALDIMLPGAGGLNDPTPPEAKALGDQIYQYLMANASQLGIDTNGTLWQQKDHYNHIHAQLLQNAAFGAGSAGLMPPGELGALGAGMPGMSGAGLAGAGGSGGVTPVFVTNWGGTNGGAAGLPPGIAPIAQAATSAAGSVVSGIGGQVAGATADALPAALFGASGVPTRGDTPINTLFSQGNALGFGAKLAGLTVPDYTRAGNDFDFAAAGTPYDATGRLFSNTQALADRTSTDTTAAVNAMRSQLVAVMRQVDTKLSDQVLQPTLSAGVTAGVSAVNTTVFQAQGAAMGQAAGPIIANAVAAAVPTDSSGGADSGDSGAASSIGNGLGAVLNGVGGQLMAGGGLVSGGTPGVDSVPILAQANEWMLNTDDVARLGGAAGVARFVGGLRSGKLRMLAAGGNIGSGPASSSALGADFFGVGQIPLIGTILNLLINVLLKVIGVNIDMRNTLNDIGGDFRSFRGDAFKAFDAQGRLFSDTSALTDRSSTSTDTAADERIRILEKVIAGLIQFIIDKVIIPLMKAVAQAAIQAAGSAISAGVSGATFGAGGAAGGIASSFVTSLGDASVDIGAQIGQAIADALVQELVPLIGGALQDLLPGLMTTIFSGLLPQLVLGPISALLTTVLGGFGGILTALFGGVFGGVASLIPGLPFDDGGIARGTGYLPKAVDADELVLNPVETDIFTKFTNALANGGFNAGNRTVHAPITVMQAGPKTADQVQDRLLKASGL